MQIIVLGVPMVMAASIPWDGVVDYLGGYPFALSGRHHVNVFLTRAGVPFLPLPSNTWKIEATLELIGYPLRPIRTHQALRPALDDLIRRRDVLATASRSAGQKGHESALRYDPGGIPCS